MHINARHILTIAALATVGAAQGIITPSAADPNFGPAVIATDSNGGFVQSINQIEMRHVGSGVYRTVVTAIMVGQTDSKLICGLLNLTTNPPTWTPQNDLELINLPGTATDEFQGSMSLDGLRVVWDNYATATYPNATGQSLCCTRPNTGVQFQPANVRAIAGAAAGGIDPHIAQDLAGTTVLLTFLDVNGDISKGTLDCATGGMTNTSLAVAGSNRPNFQFCHSSFANRDGTGAARSMCYSEYVAVTGAPSDGFWTEGINNDGTPEIILQGVVAGVATWYANPAMIGGTWLHATARAGYQDPTKTEVTCHANTNLTSGSGRISAFAPISPTLSTTYISVVAIGAAAPPYQIPPVQGDILVFPTVGVTDIRIHDPSTGLAEWVFTNVPPLATSVSRNCAFTTAAGLWLLTANPT
jgi:hypothetical protein